MWKCRNILSFASNSPERSSLLRVGSTSPFVPFAKLIVFEYSTGYAVIKASRIYTGTRNKAKAEATISQLHEDGLGPGNGQIIWLKLELSDSRNAKNMAKEFMEREERLDVLSASRF